MTAANNNDKEIRLGFSNYIDSLFKLYMIMTDISIFHPLSTLYSSADLLLLSIVFTSFVVKFSHIQHQFWTIWKINSDNEH